MMVRIICTFYNNEAHKENNHNYYNLQMQYFTGPAGANACLRIYPSVRHLLCRWHVDR